MGTAASLRHQEHWPALVDTIISLSFWSLHHCIFLVTKINNHTNDLPELQSRGAISSLMNKIHIAGGQVITEGLQCTSMFLNTCTWYCVCCCSASFLVFLSGLDLYLQFLSQVMSAVWSCSLVHYMIPTEQHTAFFKEHPRHRKTKYKTL